LSVGSASTLLPRVNHAEQQAPVERCRPVQLQQESLYDARSRALNPQRRFPPAIGDEYPKGLLSQVFPGVMRQQQPLPSMPAWERGRTRSALQRIRARQRSPSPQAGATRSMRALMSTDNSGLARLCSFRFPFDGESYAKKGGASTGCSPLFTGWITAGLLDRDFPLHAECEVRRAMERVFARLDVGEGNRDRLSRIRLERARELTHLVRGRAHVSIELSFLISRNGRWIERNVMRTTADYRELDSVACLDGQVCRLETITLRIAKHFHFVRR